MLFGVECRVTKNHEEAEVHVTETHTWKDVRSYQKYVRSNLRITAIKDKIKEYLFLWYGLGTLTKDINCPYET